MFSALIVIAGAILVFFRRIGTFPLRNWDEAWYGEIIKNMASGDYSLLVGFWNGQYYFDKPPLYFWLSLPFFKFFGPGEWQARIISSIAAVFATLLVYLIGKKLFGKTAGVISVLVFLTLGQVVIRFAHGNLDALLVCLFLATFYFYLLSIDQKKYSILCGISLGLGFLVKGWFLGLFPIFLIAVYSIVKKRNLPSHLPIILLTCLLISSWWFILGSLKFGQPFVNWYILNPGANLLSLSNSFSVSYFKDLIRDIGFWWVFIIIALFFVRKTAKDDQKIIAVFATVTFLFILPLNFLSEKLGWYNLPAYPLVALLIGFAASQLFSKYKVLTIILVCFVPFAQIYNINRIENIYPDRSTVGAKLGQHAKELVTQDEIIILDDHDFTSFLYYSDHKTVFELSENSGKPGEWWILNYEDLEKFIMEHPHAVLITRNSQDLPIDKFRLREFGKFKDYQFLRLI